MRKEKEVGGLDLIDEVFVGVEPLEPLEDSRTCGAHPGQRTAVEPGRFLWFETKLVFEDELPQLTNPVGSESA